MMAWPSGKGVYTQSRTVPYGDLYTTHDFFITFTRAFIDPERAVDYTPIKFGDVLFAASGETVEEIGKSAVNLLTSQAYCGGDIILLRPREEMDARFLGYASHSRLSIAQKAVMGRGYTVIHIYGSQLKYLMLPLPPLPEQRAIAAFLDEKTADIDALIAARERLIALLQEKRAALITQAVTKGLDADAPMKDSGIEWLGEVPVGWEVKKIKYISRKIGSGKTPSGGAETYVDSGVMLIRSQNVHFDGLRLDDVAFIDNEIDSEMSGTRLQEGDVLLNITGASLGRCCVAILNGQPANVNQHVCIIRPSSGLIDSNFLSDTISSHAVQAQIFNNENGISRDALNFVQIGNLLIPLPPLHEQIRIAHDVDNKAKYTVT